MKKIVSIFAALVVGLSALIVATDVQPASANPVTVQHTSCTDNNNTLNTFGCAFPNFITQHNLWAVAIAYNNTGSVSVTDNSGSATFTAGGSTTWGAATPDHTIKLFYILDAPASFSAVFTFGTTPSYYRVYMAEASGVLTSGAYSQFGTGAAAGITSSTSCGGPPGCYGNMNLTTNGNINNQEFYFVMGASTATITSSYNTPVENMSDARGLGGPMQCFCGNYTWYETTSTNTYYGVVGAMFLKS